MARAGGGILYDGLTAVTPTLAADATATVLGPSLRLCYSFPDPDTYEVTCSLALTSATLTVNETLTDDVVDPCPNFFVGGQTGTEEDDDLILADLLVSPAEVTTLGGNDSIHLLAECAIVRGTTINGGPGFDTLYSPVPEATLVAHGVTLISIEQVVVVTPSGLTARGACTIDPDTGAIVCACCTPPFVGSACDECPPGEVPVSDDDRRLLSHVQPGEAARDIIEDDFDVARGGPRAVDCVPEPPACAPGSCGDRLGRGKCGTYECICFPPRTGIDSGCDQCTFPYEVSPDSGECVLGDECRERRCRGRGDCVSTGPGYLDIGCTCDHAVDLPSRQCGRIDLVIPANTMIDVPKVGGIPLPEPAGTGPGTKISPAIPAGASFVVRVDECTPSDCGGGGYLFFTDELPVGLSSPDRRRRKRQRGRRLVDLITVEPTGDGKGIRINTSNVDLPPGVAASIVVRVTPKPLADGSLPGGPGGPCEGLNGELGIGLFGPTDTPEAGSFDPAFDKLHDRLREWQTMNSLPGMVVGIARGGDIVHVHSFGWADTDLLRPVSTGTPFRIASVTKPITQAALMNLAENGDFASAVENAGNGKLDVADTVLDILGTAGLGLTGGELPVRTFPTTAGEHQTTPNGNGNWDFSTNPCDLLLDGSMDERFRSVRVQDLLNHRGGFNRNARYTSFRAVDVTLDVPFQISYMDTLGYKPPADWRDVVQLHASMCVFYPPGATSPTEQWNTTRTLPSEETYSNIGYTTAAAVLEEITGLDYWQYLVTQDTLLGGLGSGIFPGRSRIADRSVLEPRYYHGWSLQPDSFGAQCVVPQADDDVCPSWTLAIAGNVPVDQGGLFPQEVMVGHGDLVSTACAYLEFMRRRWIGNGRNRADATVGRWTGSHSGKLPGVSAYARAQHSAVNVTREVYVSPGVSEEILYDRLSDDIDWVLFANGNWLESGGIPANEGLPALRALMDQSIAELDADNAWPTSPVTCATCGNGIIEEFEQCDDPQFGGQTCEGLAGLPGFLDCSCACTIGTTSCCGNDVAGDKELCDGSDFKGDSCGARGFNMGSLECVGCFSIDDVGCNGGTMNNPPASYAECIDIESVCGEDPKPWTCQFADGDCLGGPCRRTNSGDFIDGALTKFSDGANEFHPDGEFRDDQGNLYYCIGEDVVCSENDGWGVCLACGTGEEQTLVGCPCHDDAYCEQEAGLTCWGEDFATGPGLCWSSTEGPPKWHCREGFCGQAPRGAQILNGDSKFGDDEMYCEHYPEYGGEAKCMNYYACDQIQAKECAGEGFLCDPSYNPYDDDDSNDEKCALDCTDDSHCQTSGWPMTNEWHCNWGIGRCEP